MNRHSLYAYVDGSDLDDVGAAIEERLVDFIVGSAWVASAPHVVNQRAAPSDDQGEDLPDWDLGLNLALPDPGTEPEGWFLDVERIALFLGELHSAFGRDFVIGIADANTSLTEDLFFVESGNADLSQLRRVFGVADPSLSIVEVTGWKVGFLKVSCTKLLQEALLLGLKDAKQIADDILEGHVQRLEVGSASAADQLAARLNALGAIAYVKGASVKKILEPYALVRVIKLMRQAEDYDGWLINQRPPAVGDVGTLLDVLTASGVPDMYVVESSGGDGTSIWLADFLADELEVVKGPPARGSRSAEGDRGF